MHKSTVSSITTVKHSSADPGLPNCWLMGGLPVTSIISTGTLPSSMVSFTDEMVSLPAPVLQILMEYSTSIKQKWASASSPSHTYPAKVNTSSPPLSGPKVCFKTRSLGLPSSQRASMVTTDSSPDSTIAHWMVSVAAGTSTRTMASPLSKLVKVSSSFSISSPLESK